MFVAATFSKTTRVPDFNMVKKNRRLVSILLLVLVTGCSDLSIVGADRVAGVIEQNKIFDIMMSAYGWSRN